MRSIAKFLGQAALIAASAVATLSAWAAAPAMPSGTAPGTVASPGPVQASSSVKLQWGAVSNITYYGVGVRDLVTNALVVSTTTTTPSYTASLEAGKPYRWNVAACNASGCSNYTTALYFQTPAPPSHTLSVSKSGSGTVSGTGISCGTTCSASYASGTNVTLTATPAAGYTFGGWGGACAGSTCTVSMTAARSVTATFNAVPVNYTLSVSKSGSGTVSGTGINCGTTCSASYASGTNVTLTATPAAGYTFGGWGGACAGSTCTVSMTKAQSVSATFNTDSGSAKPSVVFSSNPTQYQRVTATISWGPGTIPSTAAMALNDANLLTFTTTNRTTTAVFMPQLAGAKSWVLKSRSGSDGPVLASGAITVAVAPPFPVQADTPAYAANPGGRGYCKPQCAEFVQAQLGLPGGRGYAKNFWTNPYTQQGYINQAQGQSTRPPRPGDMLVWSGTLNPGCGENGSGCGHVAIVKSVDLASGTLVRVDANWSAQWQTDCRVRETAMTVTRDPTTGAYTIGGTNSNHLFGWQSKD